MARWLADGQIEYLGRIDHQVKIRGYRIELDEIVHQLLQHTDISEALVVALKDQQEQAYLCAYIVPVEGREISIPEVRQYLLEKLPEYMVPVHFKKLEFFPLTANGKVDRMALPKPNEAIESQSEYVEPSNGIERIVVQVWESVLGVPRISVLDHFFELGGDSIKAIQVSSRLYANGLKMEVKDIFQYPILKAFAQRIKKDTKKLEDGPVEGDVALTPIQRWFFEQNFTDQHHFNQSIALYREEGFNPDYVGAAFKKIVEHHDALRATFTVDKSKVKQTFLKTEDCLCDYQVISLDLATEMAHSEIARIIQQSQKSFDLTKGPLLKVILFQTKQGDHLFLTAHHLVMDGVSWRIILEDFSKLYTQGVAGEDMVLGNKSSSYKEWADYLQEYAQSKELKRERKYWKRLHEHAPPRKKWEIESGRDSYLYQDSVDIKVTLTKEETAQLLRYGHRTYGLEMNEILLAALGLAVRGWDGSNKVLIHLEGHGREEMVDHIRLDQTIGWFTSMFPVLVDLNDCSTLEDALIAVKEDMRRIPNRGIGYGIIRYLDDQQTGLSEEQQAWRKPEISFNYLGQFDQDMNGNLFQLSTISLGEQISPTMERIAPIEFNGMLIHEQLTFKLTYPKSDLSEGQADQLAKLFAEQLRRIGSHFNQATERVFTPSDFKNEGITRQEWRVVQEFAATRKEGLEAIYSLSAMQEGLYFHSLMDQRSAAYFEQISFQIRGFLDPSALDSSFQALVQRYDIFRTSFIHEGLSRPQQLVFKGLDTKIKFHDLSGLDEGEKEEQYGRIKKHDRNKGFDLAQDVLVRLTVLKLSESRYKVIWSHHHILLDAWCLGIIFKELFGLYGSRIQGENLPENQTTPYSQYISWLEKQDKEEALDYWKSYLNGYSERIEIPRLYQKQVQSEYELEEVSFKLDEQVTFALDKIALSKTTTLSNVMRVAWGILLQKYNQTDDIVFGTVVSGRPAEIAGIEQMVGLFINTVPIRIQFNDQSFSSLLEEVHQVSLESLSYDYVSLADIQEQTELGQHLLNHVVVFENTPVANDFNEMEQIEKELGIQIDQVEAFEQTSYDFDVTIAPGKELFIKFSYNKNVYKKAYVQQIARHFQEIMNSIALNPDVNPNQIECLSSEERQQLVVGFNAKQAQLPTDQTTVHLIEQQVIKNPDSTAVRFGSEEYTYSYLNQHANQMARYLLKRGTQQEELVAILMDRSPKMVESILGIWKAGGAYIPIDPEYPKSRIETIIQESGAKYIISSSILTERIWGTDEAEDTDQFIKDLSCILVDQEDEFIAQEPNSNLDVEILPSNLAYVIFTSGSTGKPKGAMIEHAGMLNHILAEVDELHLSYKTVMAQNASHCFDISVWQFFAPLTVGGVSVIYPNDVVFNSTQFLDSIIRDEVTILEVVPAYLGLMMDDMVEQNRLPTALQYLMITGETVKQAMVRRWFELCPDIPMVNAYGPAEAADDITQYTMKQCPQTEHIPIGKPLQNLNIYIVGDHMQLLPVGVVGEICVSGIGVGRGYLHQKELSQAVFTDDPFGSNPSRLYKTGDLGRWLPDGNIEFFGRKDYQVKIRGFRIELGEIEARLVEHEQVKEAVVLDVEDDQGSKYLCAYVLTAEGVSVHELKRFIGQTLPDYMVPTVIMFMEQFPVNANGKVDRKALPKPINTGESKTAYAAPSTMIEQKLNDIWYEILGNERMGIDTSFFEVGGHSIKAMALSSKIQKEFKLDMELIQVFRNPTIREQARYLSHAGKHEEVVIEKAEEREHYPVSFGQKRMFIVHQMLDSKSSYNIPQMTLIKGKLDLLRMENSINHLLARHESLRTSFHLKDGEPVQVIHSGVDFKLDLIDMRDLELNNPEKERNEAIDKAIRDFIQPFELGTAPLFRAGIIRCANDRYILMLDTHHIISDGVSSMLLASELLDLYQGKPLANLEIQYKDYALWQREQLQSSKLQQQQKYWVQEFTQGIPVLQLPTDFVRPALKSYVGHAIDFELDEGLSIRIKNRAEEAGTTLFIYLLAAYHVLLYKYSGQEEIVIGSPVAGRHYNGLEHLLGMFVNTLALRNKLEPKQSFANFLENVRHKALHAYENQDYPLEELVSSLKLQVDKSRNPLFDVVFVIQNIDTPKMDTGELHVSAFPMNQTTSKFDLTFLVVEKDETLLFNVEYSTQLFKEQTIRQISEDYRALLKSIVDQPTVLIEDIRLTRESYKEEKVITDEISFDF
ncbi:amino acid adenylation domain-containing protein/non-ribosomal peptide synthase protein (TIGR01720 family) [Bacillus horti]|uniref:Amino acid adenylation domain-containing protein/non-ribosomal peptide synthase protein (TIGR01720 family) n=1 Tax=Caldalkalibacillus horti TaxID=77523 RepID=A0ABT9W5G2_9BACI|nr:amino acid adenylation domain-containing protein/non-ribosomal peptide synthase protein (TIGR01720 family) [Bacillus horti]